MEDDKVQSIISKIQKLRALAASTTSRGEREAAAAAAMKLIVQYQIEEASLTEKVQEAVDLTKVVILYETGKVVPWKHQLAIEVAALHGVFIFYFDMRNSHTHRKITRLRIIGTPTDTALCEYVFGYLVSEIESLSKNAVASRGQRGVNPDRQSFCLGAVNGFVAKMKQGKGVALNQASSGAMVLVSGKAESAKSAYETANNFSFSKGKPLLSKASVSYSAYSSGYQAGSNISINKSISS